MSKVATDPGHQRIFLASGAIVSVLVFGFILAGVIEEAQQLWAKGTAGLFADAGLRLGVDVLIAIVSAAPYVMLARAARLTGYSTFFKAVCMLVLAAQLFFTINALFFVRSSTAGIVVFFLPIYMCLPVATAWGVALLVRRFQRSAT